MLRYYNLAETPLFTILTEQVGLAACFNKRQTHETAAGTKGQRFIQVPLPGRMLDPHLKDHFPFLFKPAVLIGIWR